MSLRALGHSQNYANICTYAHTKSTHKLTAHTHMHTERKKDNHRRALARTSTHVHAHTHTHIQIYSTYSIYKTRLSFSLFLPCSLFLTPCLCHVYHMLFGKERKKHTHTLCFSKQHIHMLFVLTSNNTYT